jgi:hypothetical protein
MFYYIPNKPFHLIYFALYTYITKYRILSFDYFISYKDAFSPSFQTFLLEISNYLAFSTLYNLEIFCFKLKIVSNKRVELTRPMKIPGIIHK